MSPQDDAHSRDHNRQVMDSRRLSDTLKAFGAFLTGLLVQEGFMGLVDYGDDLVCAKNV